MNAANPDGCGMTLHHAAEYGYLSRNSVVFAFSSPLKQGGEP